MAFRGHRHKQKSGKTGGYCNDCPHSLPLILVLSKIAEANGMKINSVTISG